MTRYGRGAAPDPLGEHFDRLAPQYEELRADSVMLGGLVESLARFGDLTGRCVLDVGCGPGHVLAALSRGYGVRGVGLDRSARMVGIGASRGLDGVSFLRGEAERLPFATRSVPRMIMTVAVQLLDRPRAFAEAVRVLRPDGRLVLVTPEPSWFAECWLADYFPSYAPIERRRFPGADRLADELRGAGFTRTAFRVQEPSKVMDRQAALREITGRSISVFALISDDEFAAGVERAHRELPDSFVFTARRLVAVAYP